MGAANVEPAPLRVAGAPLLAELELELEPPDLAELDELLLEPHAAMASEAVRTAATVAIRLVRTCVSLVIGLRASLGLVVATGVNQL
jgi:hypothetical protein